MGIKTHPRGIRVLVDQTGAKVSMKQHLASAHSWSILDSLREGVILVLPDGTIEYMNPATYSLLGLTKTPYSLTTLFQGLSPHTGWRKLLEPPVDMRLETTRGVFRVTARPWSQDAQTWIQIMFDRQLPETEQPEGANSQLAALTRISSEPDFDRKLHLLVEGLKLAGWQHVLLTLRDAEFEPTHMISAGFNEKELSRLRILPAAAWHDLFNTEMGRQFRRGACFFVPGDSEWSQAHLGDWLTSPHLTLDDPEAWQPRDVLVVPLLDRQQKKIGLISFDMPVNGRRPTPLTLQTIELYAQFAASVIENTRLVQETLHRTRELEILFEASHELANTLDKEQVLSLMGQHLQRAALADGYIIYQWRDADKSLIVMQEATAVSRPSPSIGNSIPLTEQHSPIQEAISQQQIQVVPPEYIFRLPHRPRWLSDTDEYASILVPIVLSETTFGLVELIKQNYATLNALDLPLLAALSNQANITLETALIFEETFERERFYNALGNVNLAINYTLDLENILNLICRESRRIFNVDGVYIWLKEGHNFVGRAAKGFAEEAFINRAISLSETKVFANTIAQTRQASYINNVSQAHSVQLRLPQAEQIQAVLGVPLEQEGEIIGVLVLVDNQHRYRFSAKDLAQATTFGVQSAIALQNARLFNQLRQLNEELDLRVARRTQDLNEESNRVKILLRVTTELSASLDQDRVLNQALHLVNEVVNANQGVILLIDQESEELVFRGSLGLDRKLSPKGVPTGMMRHEGLAGWIIDNRSPVIVSDTLTDSRWVDRPTSQNIRSVLAVPLLTGEEVIGVLMLFHEKPGAFTMQQLDLVEAAAVQVANAINNANLYLLIRDQAERLGTTLHLEQIETAKNQAILESIADGVIVADAANKITLANVPASSILGVPRADLIGKFINEFLGLYGQSHHSWLSVIQNWAQNADRMDQGTYIDEQFAIEDKVVSVHLSPVLAGKQFFGTVSIFRDITKEVELDRLKSEFVSTVSHELRTPMTSIKGYVDLMLMGAAGKMSEAQTRYLQVIKNNAERLHMLVNDLLDISRIETGKTALDLRPVDISQVIDQVVVGHLYGRIQHEGKQITVHTDTPDGLPLVNVDHARITQVLTNLLDNAFNYTPAHGEIRVTARENGRYVFVSVSDTGIGISKEDISRIFDRFYRAEHEMVQKIPGTGLGLAIVRSLVEMHNGQLLVHSQPGIGSTFTFNLPVVMEDSEPA